MSARSCKQCCCGKEIGITNSECVSVALVIHHAKRMRHIVCGRPGSSVFFQNVSHCFFYENPTGALYYSNLVIYTNKPFVSNLICYC